MRSLRENKSRNLPLLWTWSSSISFLRMLQSSDRVSRWMMWMIKGRRTSYRDKHNFSRSSLVRDKKKAFHCWEKVKSTLSVQFSSSWGQKGKATKKIVNKKIFFALPILCKWVGGWLNRPSWNGHYVLRSPSLNQTHTRQKLCVLRDHVANKEGATHSSLGVGLEKNSLYSWCSSWQTWTIKAQPLRTCANTHHNHPPQRVQMLCSASASNRQTFPLRINDAGTHYGNLTTFQAALKEREREKQRQKMPDR